MWNLISKNEKESIKLGLKDAAAGMLNPHSKARELYKKWL
jgi:predicted transcriptional regulator